MSERSRKDALAICGRSGIETLKSRLVRDGYMRGLWVLPEYYESPQPIKYRPKPELPPFNPSPLRDIFLTTQMLTGDLVPYAYTSVGHFALEIGIELLPSDAAISSVGNFTFHIDSNWELIGVSAIGVPGEFGSSSGYGEGAYGEGPYGGISYAGFAVALPLGSVSASSALGSLTGGTEFGVDGYGINNYGGST